MINKLAILFVQFVSNLFRLIGLRLCRFYPTCSNYAIQAFSEFGFFKASFLTIKRLLHCHPLSEGGYDPLWKKEH